MCCAVDPDDKAMSEDALRLPRATELARMVLGEDLEALAGGRALQHDANRAHPGIICEDVSGVSVAVSPADSFRLRWGTGAHQAQDDSGPTTALAG